MRRRQKKYGIKRLKRRFLFFPKVVDKELRWFEFAVWEEMFYPYKYSVRGFWDATRWMSD